MQLNTYQSAADPEVYVTLPSVEAAAIFAIVQELAPMHLAPIRCGYTLSDTLCDTTFKELVTFEIAANGYAVHGRDAAFAQRAEPRGRRSASL